MDKADPVDTRPAANIGTPARQSPSISRHGKWSVSRAGVFEAHAGQRQGGISFQNTIEKQYDIWLS